MPQNFSSSPDQHIVSYRAPPPVTYGNLLSYGAVFPNTYIMTDNYPVGAM